MFRSSSSTAPTDAPAARKAMVPPLFGSFGKKAKDLFKKKYDFENQVKFTNKTADGMVIDSAVIASDNGLRGVFKSKVPVKTMGLANGELETEFHTVADRESKSAYTFKNLAKGATVKVQMVGVKPEVKGETPDFPEGWVQVEGEYAQEYLSGSVGVRSNQQKTLVDVTGAVGYDRVSVGGKVVVDPSSKVAPNDYNFGAQFEGPNYTLSAVTEKKRSVLALGYFQTVSSVQTIGAQASYGLLKPSRSLTLGTDYKVDVDTLVRAYAKVDSGKDAVSVGLNVEHRLLSPNALLSVSSEFQVAGSIAPSKIGVGLTFGDF